MEYTELKIQLMHDGAVFTQTARNKMCRNKFGNIVFEDYATTGGIVLQIDDEIYANVPVMFGDTPFYIDERENRFVLEKDGNILPVSINIMPVPQFALNNIRLADGKTPVRDLVMIHADRMRISPIHGCNYHCQFCTCNIQRYLENSIENLDQAVQIAFQDQNTHPRHILISGGTPKAEESSYIYLNKVYHFFPNKYEDYKFDVMLSPRGRHIGETSENAYIDFLKYLHEDCRISTLSVNLELYNEKIRKAFIPDKWGIGKENYLLFIKNAVEIFGRGNIRSSLVVGLEEKEDTLKGVEWLCACGCIPVLSAFVPASGTFAERYPRPEVDFLVDIVYKASEIAKQNGTVLGPLCKPCTHNSLVEERGSIAF